MAEAVCFHGVRLVTRGAASSLLEPMLSDFPASHEEHAGPLRIELSVEDGATQPTRGTLLFKTDRFEGFRCGQSIVVSGGRSWLCVEPSLDIRGFLAPGDAATGEDLLHLALLIALRTARVFELHAAAVCTESHALVFVGPSGSGKSTAALSLLSAGHGYLGDDRVLLRSTSAGDLLCSYPTFFRTTAATLASFPALAPHAGDREHLGKRPLDVKSAFPGRHHSEWRGRSVLLFPKIGGKTQYRAVSQAEAFERVLSQSGSLVLDGHPAPREHLELLKRLVARSPRFELCMGPEWLEEPVAAAERLLSDVVGSARPELP